LLLKPLKRDKTVNAPADKGCLMMEMFGKDQLPADLARYLRGGYVLRHRKQNTSALFYDQDPDSFNVIAVLLFKDGLLAQLQGPSCHD
jgi:hypothetical protein